MRVTINVIKALQNKQEEAFNIIYKKYYKIVYCRIVDIVKDKHIAEQLLNDVFLKVFEKAETFQIKTKSDKEAELCFYKWIMTIAKNLAINEYKKIQKNRTSYIVDLESISNRYIDYHKLKEELFPMLDEQEAKIIVDHLYCNMTFRHLSEELELSESIVNKMYHKALKKIKTKK